jgi:hypothetical protein
MAQIIKIDDEFITIVLKSGKQKDYSRELLDFEPHLNDEVDFRKDKNDTIQIYKISKDQQRDIQDSEDLYADNEMKADIIASSQSDNLANNKKPSEPASVNPSHPSYNNEKPENSRLGIIAFAISFFVGIAGAVLGIVDLCINKKNKHGFAIAAIVLGLLFCIPQAAMYTSCIGNSSSQKLTEEEEEADKATIRAAKAAAAAEFLTGTSKSAKTYYYDANAGKVLTDASNISSGYNKVASPSGSTLNAKNTGIIKIEIDKDGNDKESWILLSDAKSDTASSSNSTSSPNSTNSSSNSSYLGTITYTNLIIETDSIGNTYAYPMIEMTNTSSSDIYVDVSQIDIEDASGKIIATNDMVSTTLKILKPGEKSYAFCSAGFAMPDGTDPSAQYTMVPNARAKKASSEDVRYDVSQTQINAGSYGGFDIIGRVTNNTSKDDSYCYLTYVLFDANGAPIGAGGTSITDLTAGNTIGFEATSLMLPSSVTVDTIANYQVYAEKEVYQF